MSTFTKLTYHVVFSTKYRRKTIGSGIQERIFEYLGGTVRNLGGSLIQAGGVEDHIHLLVYLPANRSVSDCVRDIKANSSKWMSEQLPRGKSKFQWQKGYGAFTVSHSNVSAVRRYIENQYEHHRKRSFKEEFEELLQRHGIEYEPKYLFEAEQVG